MNWPLPEMTDAERPAAPRFWLWGVALLVMLVGGFLLAVYVMPDSELSDKTHLLAVAAGGPFLFWLLLFGLRLMAADIPAFAVYARNHTLALRRRQWRHWANRGMCLLAESRYTAPEETGDTLTAKAELPVNQNNRLVLSSLSGLPEWERHTLLLSTLLKPLVAWHQLNAATVPVSLCWRIASSSSEDWSSRLTQVAEQLSLPLASVEPLAEEAVTGWLTEACDSPPEGLCCLVFIELDDQGNASEEAAALMLASDGRCRALKLSSFRRLTRPLLTSYATFADALRLQCEQQQTAKSLFTGWYSNLPDNMNETLPLTCMAQRLACCGASRLYDADSALGIPGVAREAVMLSLAAQSSGAVQLFSSQQGEFCLWQVQVVEGDKA